MTTHDPAKGPPYLPGASERRTASDPYALAAGVLLAIVGAVAILVMAYVWAPFAGPARLPPVLPG